MYKNAKAEKMNYSQLWVLSYQTLCWWKAVFIQGEKFIDKLENDSEVDPWASENDAVCPFPVERMFFITALYHAIEYLEKLHMEIGRDGDQTLQSVLDGIAAVTPLDDIKNLRNMNEHQIEYLMEKGHNQEKFQTEVRKGGYVIHTAATVTFVHGDIPVALIGNVEFDRLLLVMKEQFPLVKKKTKEVYNRTFAAK